MSFHTPNDSAPARRPIVVKLGGSLAESMRLPPILELVGAAGVPVVIVPGGGAFADAVRRAQADFDFSEACAHRMALLAMHQTGLMLAGLHPRLKPVETLAQVRQTLESASVPVWLPAKLADRDPSIAATWETTSDGLAARLAERLGGVRVLLVKSCSIVRGTTLPGLVREGIVDPTFAAIVERARLPWQVLGAGDEEELAAIIKAAAPSAHARRRGLREVGRRAAPARAIARRR